MTPRATQGQPKVSAIRMIEAGIIAVIAGVISVSGTVFMTVPALRVEIQAVRESTIDLRTDVRKLQDRVLDIYQKRQGDLRASQ